MKSFMLGLIVFLVMISPIIAAVLVLCGFNSAALLVLCGGFGGSVAGVMVLIKAVADGLLK